MVVTQEGLSNMVLVYIGGTINLFIFGKAMFIMELKGK